MDKMRMPSISPEGMVFAFSFSSQKRMKAVSYDELFCMYSVTAS